MNEIKLVISHLKANGIKPDMDMFYYLMARTTSYKEVKEINKELYALGLKPNKKIFYTLLHLTEDFQEAQEIIMELEQRNYKILDAMFYVTLVSKTDTLEKGKLLIRSLKSKGIELTEAILKYRDVQEEDRIKLRKQLKNYHPSLPDSIAEQLFKGASGEFVDYLEEGYLAIVETIIEDIDSEESEEDEYHKDGVTTSYYGKRYERNPKNRAKAIEIHGVNCTGCGFNFEEAYGERGKDFIEIHHVKPLSTIQEEMTINPKTDLVPVCSNCHRMIHRKKDDVLTIEQLRILLNGYEKV